MGRAPGRKAAWRREVNAKEGSLMFIDIHVHTRTSEVQSAGGTYATPEELIEMLKPRGVRKVLSAR